MENKNNSAYIALGYFDSVHLGHRKIIQYTVNLAKKNKCKAVVFTFRESFDKFLSKPVGDVFTLSERIEIYKSLGTDETLIYPVSKTSLSKGKKFFLNYINKKYDIKGYVCGKDYSFGKNALGNIEYLKSYAEAHNQSLEILDIINYNGEKISTTKIKQLLKSGNIAGANYLLGGNYFINGTVIEGRKVGRLLGFPTANISVDNKKSELKKAVYYGYTIIDDKRYNTIINYGAQPTFNINKIVLETYIKDFKENIYGKNISIYFEDFLRDIKKFDSKEELIKQLQKDIKVLK